MFKISKIDIAQIKEKMIYCMTLITLYYYSYRYPLQYNSVSTSPTYGDTPFGFQIAKYIFMIFIIIIVLIINGNYIRIKNKTIFLLCVCLCFQQILIGIVYQLQIQFAFLLIPIILYLVNKTFVNIDTIDKIFRCFWLYSVVYESFMVLNYYIYDRLPALGYSGGIISSVRFGGPWDDPNGFSLLLTFYLVYGFFNFMGMKKFIFIASTVSMLIMTWSLTGWISCLLSILILCIIRYKDKNLSAKIRNTVIIMTVFIAIIIFFNYDTIESIIEIMLENKQGSIEQHMDSFTLADIQILTLFGIKPMLIFVESGVVALMIRGGIIALVIFYIIGISSIYNINSMINKKNNNKVLYSIITYQIAFLITMINLPLIYSFANMALYSIFTIIAYSKQKNSIFNKGELING